MLLKYIIFVFIINYTFSYFSNIKLINNTKYLKNNNMKLYMDKEIDNLNFVGNKTNNENEIKFIGLLEDLDPDNYYFIIGNNGIKLDSLINDMENINISGMFIPISCYTDIELENIINSYVNKNFMYKKKLNKLIKNKEYNNFLFFNQYEYIGELFEFYSIIYKNI